MGGGVEYGAIVMIKVLRVGDSVRPGGCDVECSGGETGEVGGVDGACQGCWWDDASMRMGMRKMFMPLEIMESIAALCRC